jgi:transcription elongation factor Elf1
MEVHDAHNGEHKEQQNREQPHFTCPFCSSYDVVRLFVGVVNVDSCQCMACDARWDEDSSSGRYRGRSHHSSVLMPRRD